MPSLRNLLRSLVLCFLAVTAASAQTRYPPEADVSPLTAEIAARLQAVAAAGQAAGRQARRFMKTGDSITANGSFFSQFKCVDFDPALHYGWDWTRDLASWGSLREAADYYKAESVPGTSNIPDAHAGGVPYPVTSFDRASRAVRVGESAAWAITGNPSPLEAEIAELNPSIAFIMFGANDTGAYGTDYDVLSTTLENQLVIVDRCLAEGIIPVWSATCPKYTSETGTQRTRLLSHLVRAAAQGRQVPFVNCHRALMPLPDHGLGEDRLHPNALGYNQAAFLTDAGLACGHNQRNRVTLKALDLVYQAVVKGSPAPDPAPAPLAGSGTALDPFRIDTVPFADARATSAEAASFLYRLDLALPLNLRAVVTDQGAVDVDLHLFDAGMTAVASSDGLLDRLLAAGTWYLGIETKGTAFGAFQFVLVDQLDQGYPKDVNRDGLFTPADPAAVARLLAGNVECLPGGASAGDVNGGGVDATDLVELGKQFILDSP